MFNIMLPTPSEGLVDTVGSEDCLTISVPNPVAVAPAAKVKLSPLSPITTLVPVAGVILFVFNSDIVIYPFLIL
jgi:hypothetical protein